MKKRLLSIITTIVMVCSFVGVMPKLEMKVKAASKAEIQNKMVSILYNNSGGYMSCDFDGYVNTKGRHEGIDFAKSKGSAIYSLTDGEVIRVSNSSSLSTLAVYDAQHDKTVLYLHCNISVNVGTKLSKGQCIGKEWVYGTSAAHTHVEVRNGKQQYACKSVNDNNLENENPYSYWGSVLFGDNRIDTPIDTSYKTPYSNVTPKNTSGLTLVYDVYGIPYNTSVHNIAPGDNCTVHEVYKTGFCKVTYPTSNGTHTEYAKTDDLNIPYNVDVDPRFAPYMPLTAYLCNNATAYVATGEIWVDDKCKITAVYIDGTCDVTYPVGNGTKNVRTSLSIFIPNTSANFEKVTANGTIYAYSRPDMALNIGYTDPGDACVKVATSGDKVQIIYPISGGYKIGFVNASDVPHAHSYGSWLTTQNATCTANGNKQRKCSICGYSETQTINKLGHSMSNWATTKNATCAVEGSKTRNCSRCEYSEVQTIAKVAHKYTSSVVAATCKDKGYTKYTCSVCKHTYNDKYTNVTTDHKWGSWATSKNATCTADGSKTRKCSVCGKTETQTIKKTGHKYTSKVVAPTCTAKGYTLYVCECGDSYKDNYTDMTVHKFGEWTIVENPTCTTDGSQTRSCTIAGCNYKETQSIAKLEHKLGIMIIKESSCESEGSKTRSCTREGCNYKEIQTVAKKEHSYTSKVVAPTCVTEGYTLYTCRCGDSYKDEYTDMTEHEYGEWTVIKNPTCSENGLKEQKCIYCEDTLSQEIARTYHEYSEKEIVKPTCKKEGYTIYECLECNDTYKDDFVKPTGHKYESEEFDPGNGRKPFTLFTCIYCKGSYKDTVSKKDKGDFDKDGTLKITDAVFMKKILTKVEKPDSEEIMIADVNQDGTVNVFDMIIMKRTLMNK